MVCSLFGFRLLPFCNYVYRTEIALVSVASLGSANDNCSLECVCFVGLQLLPVSSIQVVDVGGNYERERE